MISLPLKITTSTEGAHTLNSEAQLVMVDKGTTIIKNLRQTENFDKAMAGNKEIKGE
jgi:hypothetical protein